MPSSPDSVPPPETAGLTAARQETIIIDLENDSENSDGFDTMPFRFLDLGPELRNRILKEVLVHDWYTIPYYNNGSLEAIESEVQASNYDTSILSTSKQINQEAATLLYGQNIFYFKQPLVALWFFKHIGAQNLSKVRQVSLVLSSASLEGTHRRRLDVVDERLWQEVFAWLKPRHRIDEIELNFSLWHNIDPPRNHRGCRSGKMGPRWNHINGFSTPPPVNDMHWFRRYQMQMARNRVLQILSTYRGFSNVMIISGEATLTSKEVTSMIEHMERDREETAKVGTNTSRIIDFGRSS